MCCGQVYYEGADRMFRELISFTCPFDFIFVWSISMYELDDFWILVFNSLEMALFERAPVCVCTGFFLRDRIYMNIKRGFEAESR